MVKRNEAHRWRVGDLCIYDYSYTAGTDRIFRVIGVNPGSDCLNVVSLFNVIVNDTANHTVMNIPTRSCIPLSLIELATKYAQLGLFIAQEAKRLGGTESETDVREVPAGPAADQEGR